MRHDPDTALDQCLAWLRAGKDMEGCLERYPEYAEELRPLLMLAIDVGRVTIPAVPSMARAAGQRRMLAAHAKRVERSAQTHPVVRHVVRLAWALVPGRPGSLRPAWPAVVAVLIALLLATSGVTVASSIGSLPGDSLYPVKLASQKLQLALTVNPVAHRLLAERYDAQRRQDVHAVLKSGRRATVEFHGTLQSMAESLWIVSGLPVALRETTSIVGIPYLGAAVRVGGELPGDGQLVALWMRIESEMAPMPTPTPEATHTSPPTSTPTRAKTPAPTRTLQPTLPVEGTEAPASGDTRVQTETPSTTAPEPASTPEMEETPASTGTLELPETEGNDDMPGPTEAPEPAATPEPDGTPGQDNPPDPPETTGPGETPEHGETPEMDERPEVAGTPVDDDEPEEHEEPEEEETPVDDDGPEEGETPEPGSTPDD
jgi:hypothetical protein